MTQWNWAVGDNAPDTQWRHFLSHARSRRIVWQLDGSSYAAFSVDARTEEAAQVHELQTDLACWRNGGLMFRGRIGSENDEISENVHTTTFYAMDYRGMLEFRRVGTAGRTFTNTDVATVMWTLLSESQALTGGNWGVTQGVGFPSGVLIDADFNAGKPLKEAMTDLGQDHGIDWEISPELELNLWHGGRGNDNGIKLIYGSSVLRVHRSINPTDFANAVIVSGTQTLSPFRAVIGDMLGDPRGLWEDGESKSNFVNQAALENRAQWLLDRKKVLRSSLRVTLMPGFWGGKAHIWLGDTVIARVRSGRLSLNDQYTVSEIAVDPGDDPNGESVDMILNPV